MIYGKNKARDMARSLLPSTRRKGASDDKTAEKRAVRHEVNTELHKMTLDPEAFDNSIVDVIDSDVHYIVRDRREADKIAPFQRWAEAITKRKPQDNRLPFVKALLPDGVIGEHALSHIDSSEHFATQAEKQLKQNIELNRKEGNLQSRRYREDRYHKFDRDEAIELLREIIATHGFHKQLNNYVERSTPYSLAVEHKYTRIFNEVKNEWEYKDLSVSLPLPPGTKRRVRKLLGLHDIETYYDDMLGKNRKPEIIMIDGIKYTNPEVIVGSYDAMITFIRAVKDKKPLPKFNYLESLSNRIKGR